MAKKTYDILKSREYTNSQGEVKTAYTTVGAAWDLDKGGMSLQIEDGISVTGKLVILPRRDRAEGDE